MTVINSATITGGLSGDGVTRAAPITFTGGPNVLELRAGSAITGNVVAFSAADTFRLGGTTSASFDASQIGAAAQYRNLTLTSGSTLTIELNGAVTPGTDYDQVNVTGTVTLSGATLNVVVGFVPTAGQVFTIIDNDLVDPVTGMFAGLAEGSTFTVGGRQFRISYVGGDGNDVTLAATVTIPTLSTWGFVRLGLLLALTALRAIRSQRTL